MLNQPQGATKVDEISKLLGIISSGNAWKLFNSYRESNFLDHSRRIMYYIIIVKTSAAHEIVGHTETKI